MQSQDTTLIDILRVAASVHADVEVVSQQVDSSDVVRYSYRDAWKRVCRLAAALQSLGINKGDRVATLAWNTHRHWESWFAVAGLGAICHTVNLRLDSSQLKYILSHAQDRLLLVDPQTWSLVESIVPQVPSLETVIVLSDPGDFPIQSQVPGGCRVLCYETLLAESSEDLQWPTVAPETPSSLCYTSGTTGSPKGVLYTHRSNLLHASATMAKGGLGISSTDCVLMAVPMFHANSWGLAYSCPMAGAKLVLPANHLRPDELHHTLEAESVTFSAGIPTIWSQLLDHLSKHGLALESLQELNIGGAPPSRELISRFDELGVNVIHGWGMTELSPVGTICRLKHAMQSWPYDRRMELRQKQGLPLFGIEMKILDADDKEAPRDGHAQGRLLVRGPWVVDRYFGETDNCTDAEGWFDTGDIATIDPHGYLQILDRSKDVIKSGGEWISSVLLENAVMDLPAVTRAAVLAVPDKTWGERPFLVVQLEIGQAINANQVHDHLRPLFPKWWLPDRIQQVTAIPLTSTGKINKVRLREQLGLAKSG